MPKPRVITHEVGEWTWNADKLKSHILDSAGTSCKKWQGNANTQVNLFGGYKFRNGTSHGQMNNASRFLWMTEHGEDISDYSVRMTCGNRHCAQIAHMYLDVNLHKATKKVKYKKK